VIEYALNYAQRGWPVFPLHPNGKAPLTQNGFKEATREPEKVNEWWSRWPDANIGIVTGRDSGIVVLDVDIKHGVDGTAAAAQLDLPETMVVKTAGGGYHLIFQLPKDAVIPRKIGVRPGLDILGEGGYFVAPGSVVNHRTYEIVRNRPIAECPSVIVQLASQAKMHEGKVSATLDQNAIGEGGRNNFLTSLGGKMRRIGLDQEEMTAALLMVNTLRCKPALPESDVRRIAASIGRYMPDTKATEEANESAPVVTRTLDELMAANFPPPEYLLDPVLRHPGVSLWFGPSGISKTYLVLGMALSLASGRQFLRWRPDKPHGVLYVDGELGRRDMRMRIEKLMRGHELSPKHFHLACFDDQTAGLLPDLETPEGQQRFIAAIPEGIEVIVLDSLSTLTSMAESNDYASWTQMQRFLLKLRRLGYSVVVVHHANKGGNDQAGTSRRVHVMETVVSLRKHETEEGVTSFGHDIEIHITKGRNLAPQQKEPFIASLVAMEDSMAWNCGPDLANKKRDQIEQMLRDGVPAGAIVEDLGVNRAYVYRVKSQLGLASMKPKGNWKGRPDEF
jgi:hypothetical protein